MFSSYLTQDSRLYVPLTDSRYQIELGGFSVSDNDNVLRTQINDRGENCVELDWYAGRRLYPLSKVIAHAFKPIKVPTNYWDKISVEFFDNDSKNVHPANLVWRFPKELGSEERHGFCHIPMFGRYMISREGAVFDMQRKRFMKATYSQGYFRFTLISDLGDKLAVPRHRLLGFVFLDYPTNVDKMTINHINGVKGDDRLENLEWATHAENIRHAISSGLRETPKPVLVEDMSTGVIKRVESVRLCCRQYDVLRAAMVERLTQEPWVYEQWPYRFSFEKDEDRAKGVQIKTKTLVRNMRDGSVVEYDSLTDCANNLGMSLSHVNSRIRSEHDRVYPDGLQIRRKKDVASWYEPENLELAIASSGYQTPCEVRDCTTGQVSQYASQEEARASLGICEAAMHVWLSHDGKRILKSQSDGRLVQARRRSVLEDWWVPDDPQREYDKFSFAKRVIVRNIKTGEDTVYDSAVQCAAAHQILTTTLNYRLSTKGQRKFEYEYLFKYSTEELEFKSLIYVPPPRKRVRKTSLIAGKKLRASDTKFTP